MRVMEMTNLKGSAVLHGLEICRQLSDYFQKRNIPTFKHVSRNSWKHGIPGMLDALRWLKRFPDQTFIIWAHHSESHRWLQIALAWKRRSFFVSERLIPNNSLEAANSRSRGLVKPFVSSRADRVIVCGYDQAKSYRKFFSRNANEVEVIPNSRPVAVLSSKVRKLRENVAALRTSLELSNTPIVVCVGRLTAQKDQASLITAINTINARRPNEATLVLVGDGDAEASLRAMVDGSGRVLFAGHQVDPLPWLAAADVFVLPSLAEGLPGALIEAMAAGVPSIATDIPGNKELVIHERTGLLVPPKNPTALATAIERLIGNPSEAQTFAAAGYQHVLSNYDEAVEQKAWKNLFSELVEDGQN